MSNRRDYEIPWWAIVLGFIFFWPVGMILLLLNLSGVKIPAEWFGASGPAPQRQQQPPTASMGQTQAGAGTGSSTAGQSASGAQRPYQYGYSQAQSRGKAGLRRLFKEPKGGKGMTAIGAIISLIFSMGFVEEFSFALEYGLLSYAGDWFPPLGFLCAGLFLLFKGIGKTRLAKRAKLYQGFIGQRGSVFLSDLASSAGVSEKKLIADLQKMLSDGTLPMGYIDKASGRLVLTDQGYEAPTPKAEKAQPTAKPKGEDDDTILREIRAVNDAIPGEEMTRKIDRIGEITKKILDYQRQNPAKAGQLRQFLNYYLPTTLKLLKTYAQLDAQGVEGENITAAKQRIEGMMDKVVEGFEKQLDQLFQTDAMDIASDVDVLERMLEKDGLGSGMTIGEH